VPEDEPWLPATAPAALVAAEQRMIAAVRVAFRTYLGAVRAAVLDHDTEAVSLAVSELATGVVTADADPAELAPNFDAWPPVAVWTAAAAVMVPVSAATWEQAFTDTLTPAQALVLSGSDYLAEHLADTTTRLTSATWPDEVYNAVRTVVTEAIVANRTLAQIRADVATTLGLSRWSNRAMVIARTEVMAAHNGGTWRAGLARQQVLGETLFKHWQATSDTRTRLAHRVINGAVVAADEPFLVDGVALSRPHDPLAPADQTVQCRCTLNWLDEDEADEARRLYALYLPNVTDNEGNPVVTTATPTAPAAPAPAALALAAPGVTAAPAASAAAPAADPVTAAAGDGQAQTPLSGWWAGPLLALNHRTGDSGPVPRMFGIPEDGISSTVHPWLSWQEASGFGHEGKVSIGRPEVLWVAPHQLDGVDVEHLWGAGSFDMSDPVAVDVARKVADGFAGTVSVDPDSAQVELRWLDADGKEVDEPDEDDIWAFLEGEDIGCAPVDFFHTWRFAGTTLVQDPAFHTGWVQVTDTPPAELAGDNAVWTRDVAGAVTASAAVAPPTGQVGSQHWCEQVAAAVPWEPPAAFFTNPQLTGPTKVTVTGDGRVHGHVARWDTLHETVRIPPPRCPLGGTYAKFHRHPVTTADGHTVLTGPLATGGHADTDPRVSLTTAQAHYDNPLFVLADVVAGEDDHGIWVSGALRPGVSPFQVMLAYRYSFSGDWRDQAMIAACSCSVPAYELRHDQTVVALAAAAGPNRPTLASPRQRSRRYRDGSLAVLVASGIIRPSAGRLTRGGRPPSAAGPTGWDLYRGFQAAAATDGQVRAALGRVVGQPAAVAAAAARMSREAG